MSVVTEGSPLLFYESGTGGGQSAIVAVARAVGVTLEMKKTIPSNVERRGVLDKKALDRISATEKVAVTRFDNIMMFEKPVRLARLREIGCVDGSNLVTARRVSPEHLAMILDQGQANG